MGLQMLSSCGQHLRRSSANMWSVDIFLVVGTGIWSRSNRDGSTCELCDDPACQLSLSWHVMTCHDPPKTDNWWQVSHRREAPGSFGFLLLVHDTLADTDTGYPDTQTQNDRDTLSPFSLWIHLVRILKLHCSRQYSTSCLPTGGVGKRM